MNLGKIDINALANLTLGQGSGGPQLCLMEAVAFITGEDRTDRPACVAPSLITMGIKLNDLATHEQRQTLKAFVPRLIGTADDAAAEETRKYLCIDAAVREFAPLGLERSGLTDWAARLRALPEIVNEAGAKTAHALARDTKQAATYASDTASAAAYAAAAAAAASTAAAAAAAAFTAIFVEMGPWTRLKDLFDQMIRVSETPLGITEATPAACVAPDRRADAYARQGA